MTHWFKIKTDSWWDGSHSFTFKAQQQGEHERRRGAWRTFYHTAYVCRIKNQCGITATNTTRPPWLSSYPSTCPSGEWWGDTRVLRFSPLTCSVRFTQADLGDAARVTVRSPPLQHAILIQPVRRCHGDRRCTVPQRKASPTKVIGTKSWSRFNVVGVLRLQLLVYD